MNKFESIIALSHIKRNLSHERLPLPEDKNARSQAAIMLFDIHRALANYSKAEEQHAMEQVLDLTTKHGDSLRGVMKFLEKTKDNPLHLISFKSTDAHLIQALLYKNNQGYHELAMLCYKASILPQSRWLGWIGSKKAAMKMLAIHTRFRGLSSSKAQQLVLALQATEPEYRDKTEDSWWLALLDIIPPTMNILTDYAFAHKIPNHIMWQAVCEDACSKAEMTSIRMRKREDSDPWLANRRRAS